MQLHNDSRKFQHFLVSQSYKMFDSQDDTFQQEFRTEQNCSIRRPRFKGRIRDRSSERGAAASLMVGSALPSTQVVFPRANSPVGYGAPGTGIFSPYSKRRRRYRCVAKRETIENHRPVSAVLRLLVYDSAIATAAAAASVE